MEDQIPTINVIMETFNRGDLETTQFLVKQLNKVAEERGFGKGYWARFCESMVEAHEMLAR